MGDSFIELLRAEMGRFRSALPELLKSKSGLWVVFYEGKVVSEHGSQDAALDAANENLQGLPVVVACVEKSEPVPLSAAAIFGL